MRMLPCKSYAKSNAVSHYVWKNVPVAINQRGIILKWSVCGREFQLFFKISQKLIAGNYQVNLSKLKRFTNEPCNGNFISDEHKLQRHQY